MIALTETAAGALRSAIGAASTPIAGLRVAAHAGGCSGFQYELGLVESVDPADLACESQGLAIFVDAESAPRLTGTIIDFIETVEGSGFSFNNPRQNPNAPAENRFAEARGLRRFTMTENLPASEWVYLDNNATTRMDARVVDAMLPLFCDNFANASSGHPLGMAAAKAVRTARGQVKSLIGAAHEKEIIFTSGGSESNTAAIFSALETQAGRDEIVTSMVEHPAILSACAHLERMGKAKIHRIPVDRYGSLDIEAYRSALSCKTALVTMQWANNETGILFPVEMLAQMAHKAGAIFHCDAVQAAGKVAIDVESSGIDMLTLSAHKLHGPKGIGALYVRNGVRFASLIHGGRQERGRRAGTENTPAIAGFGVAAELAAQAMAHEMPRIAALRDRLEQEILEQIPGSMLVGEKSNRLPNTLNIAFENVEADSVLLLLERAFIAASSGSACATGSMEPSHVLRAMKVPFSCLRGSVRFSFSRENTEQDVNRVLQVMPEIANEMRACAMPLEVCL